MRERIACLTLDLEPDFQSRDSHEVLLDDDRFAQVEAFLLRNRLKLTVFVVGKMLVDGLPIRTRFENLDPEFELHSYSHDTDAADSEREIVEGKKAYLDYFGRPPRGYRAPNGAISGEGIAILHNEGFLYDSSVFPAWRPELGTNFRRLPTTPWAYKEFPKLIELPFGVVPRLRVVISLSFLKLLGLSFYKAAFHTFGFPDVLVFDSHLYDFFPTSAIVNLPSADWRRLALMRNHKDTIGLLQKFVDFLTRSGYRFVSMGELYKRTSDSIATLPTVPAEKLRVRRQMRPEPERDR